MQRADGVTVVVGKVMRRPPELGDVYQLGVGCGSTSISGSVKHR